MSKLIVQVMVGNEENRIQAFLGKLPWTLMDCFLVLDDHSTDNTRELLRSWSRVIIRDNGEDHSIFNDPSGGMSVLRDRLWDLTRGHAQPGDWILALDVDQYLNAAFQGFLPSLLGSRYDWIGCRLFDEWERGYYRSDGYWSPLITRLFRFKDVSFGRPLTAHASNLPAYLDTLTSGVTYEDLAIVHTGWSCTPEERLKKQAFYLSISHPGSINHQHALSITRPPVLKPVY